MSESRKFSRKDSTIIRNITDKTSAPGSVLRFLNPETKKSEHFIFVSNPIKPPKDQTPGKTSLVGKGTLCRVKFAIPVQPLSETNKEFIEIKREELTPKVIKIFSMSKSDKLPVEVTLQKNPLFFHNQQAKKGKLYFVTNYKGETLTTIMKKIEAKAGTSPRSDVTPQAIDFLNLKQFLQVILNIATLIREYHLKKMAIGDLSTDNLALTRERDAIVASLIDFDNMVTTGAHPEKVDDTALYKLFLDNDIDYIVGFWNSWIQLFKLCTSKSIFSSDLIQKIISAAHPEKFINKDKSIKMDMDKRLGCFILCCTNSIDMLKTKYSLKEEDGIVYASIAETPVISLIKNK